MPLLLLPLVLAGLFALYVLLLPVAIVQRYRHGRARRRVQPWFVRLNGWLLLVSALGFLAVAVALEAWVPDAMQDAWLGLSIGMGVGLGGLLLDRFEALPDGLYRTPHRGLLLVMSLLLAARIVLGLWLAWDAGSGAASLAWVSRGGLLTVAGVLLGYGLATAWGLRVRLARQRR